MRKWMVQAELQHCRWAMLGFLGAVGAELMTKVRRHLGLGIPLAWPMLRWPPGDCRGQPLLIRDGN